jgi:uncharacterized membrane protein
MVLAAALRLPAIARDGLWSDECVTATWAALPCRELVAAAGADNHVPLFFLLEKLPLARLGQTELAARLLPALFGLITVVAVFAAGNSLTQGTGLLAAFLLAISPMHVHYAREARDYALLMLLVVLAFAAAQAVRRRGTRRDVVVLALVLALALYSHATAPFYLLGVLAACAFPPDRRTIARLAAACALGAALWLPWVPVLLAQGGRAAVAYAWNQNEWQRRFPWQLARSWAALTHGSLAPVRNSVPDILPSAWAGAALVTALVVLALRRRGQAHAESHTVLRLLVACVVPLVALFGAACVGPPIYVVGRSDAPVLPLFMLLLAHAVSVALPRVRALVALVCTGLAVLPLQAVLRLDVRSQEKLIAHFLARQRAPGEVVVSTAFLPCLQLYAGLRPGQDLLAFPQRPALTAQPDGATSQWIDWRLHTQDRLPGEARALAERVRDLSTGRGAGRVWVVRQQDAVGAALTAAFDAVFTPAGVADLHYLGSTLTCYRVPPATAAPR